MNNKGFMMAEVVVVSAVILTFMSAVYMSYNKIFSLYKKRVTYYDITTLYKLGYYRDLLIDYDKINDLISEKRKINKIESIDEINLDSGDKLYFIYNKKYNLDSVANKEVINYFNNQSINKSFNEYIEYLSTSATLKSNYVMILESCSDINSCYYAYLEVYDGYE